MQGMATEVVFDIETLPVVPPEEANHATCRTNEDVPDLLRGAGLSPLTARTLAVVMLNPETLNGKIWYEHPGGAPSATAAGPLEAVPANEQTMLAEFWRAVTRFQKIVTFNGRSFDCPFLMLRSALVGVIPSRNLIPYRYSAREHCDLLDQLTFYGATRKFTLESYCRGFGIDPPGGAQGRPDLSLLVEERRYGEIAEYAGAKAVATAELYRRWKRYLSPVAG